MAAPGIPPDEVRRLAELVEQEGSVLGMATSDELTGLNNRRGFVMLAHKVLEVCRRQSLPAMVVYADIERFRDVNDRFGRAEGDRLLAEVGQLLLDNLRASDVLARVGSDEFAALLVGAYGAGAAGAIERLRESVAARNAESGAPYVVRLSVGTATFEPRAPLPLEDLIATANRAMHQERREGHATPGPG